jgi:hypothetical protein
MRDDLNHPSDYSERRAGFGPMGIVVALGLAIALGLIFWGMSGTGNPVADNGAPGVTTGSNTAAPSPSNPPAVKSPVGQGESNSTR